MAMAGHSMFPGGQVWLWEAGSCWFLGRFGRMLWMQSWFAKAEEAAPAFVSLGALATGRAAIFQGCPFN